MHSLSGCHSLGDSVYSIGWNAIGSVPDFVHCFASHPDSGHGLVVGRTQCLDLVLIADPVGGLVDDSGAVVDRVVVDHAVDRGLDGSDAVLVVLVSDGVGGVLDAIERRDFARRVLRARVAAERGV